MNKKTISQLVKNVLKANNKLNSSLSELSQSASELFGSELVADICNGDEIEFRKEDDDYIPTLYSLNGNWFISWLNFDNDEVLDVYWANTIEEVVKIAYDGYQAKVIEEVNGEPPTKEQLEKV